MEKNYEPKIIDLNKIFSTLWTKRKVFYLVWSITFVLSSTLILCVPRKYQSTVILAPEGNNEPNLGALGSISSSLGIDIGRLSSSDAIQPTIYPDVVGSPDFLLPLFETRVVSADEKICARYYDYMRFMQKNPFWKYPKLWYDNIRNSGKGNNSGSGTGKEFNPFWLSKTQQVVLEDIQKNITCTVDKKTSKITITVKDQDKLICATMADVVSRELQKFITNYRTQKAKVDADYFYQMMKEAAETYESARIDYVSFADSHIGNTLENVRTELQRLQSEMLQKQNIQNTFQQQYLASTARLQANTPVYTVIKSASVPEKASSPKRVIFVLMMLSIVTATTSIWLIRDFL